MLFAVACTTSVDGGGNAGSGGDGGDGNGGSPSTSSGPPTTPVLKPNPNNPVGCPPTLPTIGAPCPSDGSWLACSYVGDTCMEWVTCGSECGGTTVSSSIAVGVGGSGTTTTTTGGGYGGYPGCSGYWEPMGSQALPACNPVDCDYANDGDPCSNVGDSCGGGDECSYTMKTCEADLRWSVESSYDGCCYDGCGGYGGYGSSVTSTGVGASGGFGGTGGAGGGG